MANKYVHFINGKEVSFTKEEITARKTEEAKAETEIANYITNQEQKVKDAKSGNDKLLALGLTQAEATALTGYTPPKE